MDEINTSMKSDFQIESDLKSPCLSRERSKFVDNEVRIPVNQVDDDMIDLNDFQEIDQIEVDQQFEDEDDQFSEHLEQMAEDNDHLVDEVEFSLLNKSKTPGNLLDESYHDLENQKGVNPTPKMSEKQIEPYQKPITTLDAQDMLSNLEEARKKKDGEQLSNLVFDAECENMGDQIDLEWYECYAASLMAN